LPYKLLDKFRDLFDGKVFRHRASTHGDNVAIEFYEDLYGLQRSQKYVTRVNQGLSVLNVRNIRHGVVARRGDGSFGEIVPNIEPVALPGYSVKRGPIATIEIGIEVKIISKAMGRQIDRVINDLKGQASHFKAKKGPLQTVGIVGVNWAQQYVSFEGDRAWPTTGSGKHLHPFQQAAEMEQKLLALAAPSFDEFLILRFDATNMPPYPFQWIDPNKTQMDYGAVLARVSNNF
jgi:hypothetical protein